MNVFSQCFCLKTNKKASEGFASITHVSTCSQVCQFVHIRSLLLNLDLSFHSIQRDPWKEDLSETLKERLGIISILVRQLN